MEIEQMTTWGHKGRELTNQLKDNTDEDSIKALAIVAIKDIYESEDTAPGRANALKMLNREILKEFPRKQEQAEAYYHDPSGRADLPKWRHLIFKFLTLSAEDWDKAGTETRKKTREEWKDTQPTEQPTEQPIEQPIEQPKNKSKTSRTTRTQKPKHILKAMTIEQLELDADTQTILKDALEHSGLSLEDFLKQAIKVYAKTVTGKAKQTSEDLSNIPTQDLLNNPKYSTHPARAEELTKRAVRAIKFFNSNKATENADRWCITQSAIASLTGSRQGTIKQILEQFKDDIESHNQTYGLNGYSNRKPGTDITEKINLAELIPNGVD